jgi:hypothetical protein
MTVYFLMVEGGYKMIKAAARADITRGSIPDDYRKAKTIDELTRTALKCQGMCEKFLASKPKGLTSYNRYLDLF